VPVLGSGDVFSAEDALAMLDETGVDAVMIARGSRGNPWIFREARALIDRGEHLAPPTTVERVDVAREHFTALVEFAGDRALRRMRKHLSWYTAGLPRATHVREGANRARSPEEMYALLDGYRAYLAQREAREERPGSDGGNRLA
jgi:tRNA-dihydrouridine synthase